MLIAIGIIVAAFVAGMAIVLCREERDRQYRRANGLPPKRYHDVTDLDPTERHLLNIEGALRKKK